MLLALLSELDSVAFSRAINGLRGRALHPMHRRTVALMLGRLQDQAVRQVGPGVPLHVAPDLQGAEAIAGEIARWCETPGLDLTRVTRIDVIAHLPGMDYLGRYNLFFSGIVLVWPGVERGPRWFRRLSREFTFYHEVGHHACGHVEFGQVAEQEREADRYAGRMIRNAHPVLTGTGRVLLAPVLWWWRRKQRQDELPE